MFIVLKVHSSHQKDRCVWKGEAITLVGMHLGSLRNALLCKTANWLVVTHESVCISTGLMHGKRHGATQDQKIACHRTHSS